jgi:hypothetical protein
MSGAAWGETAWGESPTIELSAIDQVAGCENIPANIMLAFIPVTQTAGCENIPANIGLLQVATAVTQSAGCENIPANITQNHKTTAVIQSSSCENIAANIAVSHLVVPVIQSAGCENIPANITQNHLLVAVIQSAGCENYANNANFLAFSYSTEGKSITNYSNFNFTGSCVFNGKTLLINDTGLFEYGGESDNGMAIVASMKTGKMNGIMGKNGVYPSNKIKRIPDAKVVIDCDKAGGEVTVNVTADENAPLSYTNAISHSGFATHRVPIGRGIKFNYVQLEVIGTGCTHLDISSIEYNPVENVRRER